MNENGEGEKMSNPHDDVAGNAVRFPGGNPSGAEVYDAITYLLNEEAALSRIGDAA